MKKVLIFTLLIVGLFAFIFIQNRNQRIDCVQYRYEEHVSNYFLEQEESLKLIINYFLDSEVLAIQSNETIEIKINKKTFDITDLEDDIRDIILNLFSTKQIILFESLPDGFRFEIQCEDRRVSLNIIFVYEPLKKSAFWDDTYFLKRENICWLNENWYISYGLKTRG